MASIFSQGSGEDWVATQPVVQAGKTFAKWIAEGFFLLGLLLGAGGTYLLMRHLYEADLDQARRRATEAEAEVARLNTSLEHLRAEGLSIAKLAKERELKIGELSLVLQGEKEKLDEERRKSAELSKQAMVLREQLAAAEVRADRLAQWAPRYPTTGNDLTLVRGPVEPLLLRTEDTFTTAATVGYTLMALFGGALVGALLMGRIKRGPHRRR